MNEVRSTILSVYTRIHRHLSITMRAEGPECSSRKVKSTKHFMVLHRDMASHDQSLTPCETCGAGSS